MHTLDRSSLAMAWKPKQEQQHRSEDSLLGAVCRISSARSMLSQGITVESNAAVLAVGWFGVVAMPNGWPRCTTTATMMAADLSNKRNDGYQAFRPPRGVAAGVHVVEHGQDTVADPMAAA